jgi:lipopolysaccharide export system permease protein
MGEGAGLKRLDRYILKEVTRPLLAALLIALGALLLERLVRLLDLLVNEGGPLGLILQMLVNLVPHYIGLAVPAAFFVAVLLAVMRLVRDSEMDALQSFGIGLPQLLRPIMALAVLLTVVVAITFTVLQPYTRYAYRALVHAATSTAVEASLARGSNFTRVEDKTVMIEERSKDARNFSGIFVHEKDDDGRTVLVTGEEGALLKSQEDLRLIMRLSNGQRIEIEPSGEDAKLISFEQLDQPFDERLAVAFRARGVDEREFTLFELLHFMRTGEKPRRYLTYERLAAEFHARLARIAVLPVLPLLAISLGVSSRRSNRGYGLIAGLLLLLIFHYLLQLGENLGHEGVVPPSAGVWTPFTVFTLMSIWIFRRTATRPGAVFMGGVIEAVELALSRLSRRKQDPAEAR